MGTSKGLRLAMNAGLALALVLTGAACSKPQVGGSQADMSSQSLETSEDALLVLLTRSENYAQQLTNLSQPEADTVASDLGKGRKKILDLIKVQAVNSNPVRQQIDLLSLNIVRAVEVLLRFEINRVERESIQRDNELTKKIDQLTADLGEFKSQVNRKFNSVEEQLSKLNSRITALDDSFSQFKAATVASDAAIRQSIADLRQYTKEEITETREMNNKLKEELLKQQETLEQLFSAEAAVGDLQAKLCKVSDARPACTGALGEDASKCCLTIDNVNCSEVFPNEIQVAARNQCNIIVQVIKNHDAQLQAIHEVDAKQTALIDDLLKDVADLNKQIEILQNQLSVLTKAFEIVENRTDELIQKIKDHEHRILILEFKAARAEAAATLDERSDLYLAWVARRTADVSNRYCRKNKDSALASFDYQSARQNYQYCHERLEWLVQAKEMIQLAKAYTAGLQSINVDTMCGAVINGQNAETLSASQLVDPAIFTQVTAKCTTGGQVLARAMLLNILSLQNGLGPDFRTVNYMAKKAKVAQLLVFGKMAAELSQAERASFELVDPTHSSINDTIYARIERTFKKRYVETRMRTVANTFPEDPASLPSSISGFDVAYTNSEISAAGDAYLARLKALEIEGTCADCGWKVTGRNASTRDGKARFSFPKDRESLCPIINDDVVLKNANGKHYAYRLSYNGFIEDLKPVLSGGNHMVIANSDADLANGNFSTCHYRSTIYKNALGQAILRGRAVIRMTTPYAQTYAGRGSCVKTTVVCMNREEDYVAPAGSKDFIYHLSGFNVADLEPLCKFNMGSQSTVRVRDVRADELKSLYSFKGVPDSITQASIAKATESTTQLGSNYWMWQDVAVNYGVGNQTLSKTTPFYVAPAARSTPYVREHYKVTVPPKVQECTPNETI